MQHVERGKQEKGQVSLADARDAVWAALGEADMTAALRATAIDLAVRGLGREGVELVYASICDELSEAGRVEEAAVVSYVLDMVAEW